MTESTIINFNFLQQVVTSLDFFPVFKIEGLVGANSCYDTGLKKSLHPKLYLVGGSFSYKAVNI